MDGNRIAPCRAINADCPDDAGNCPSFRSRVPCWSTNDVLCCQRNDKSRCCYCSIYLNFLAGSEAGLLFRTKQASFEDDGFKRIATTMTGRVESGGFTESDS